MIWINIGCFLLSLFLTASAFGAYRYSNYGPYTIDRLLQPVVLEEGKFAVQLAGYLVDDVQSLYIPDAGDFSALKAYNTARPTTKLRLRICAVAPMDISMFLTRVSAATVYGTNSRNETIAVRCSALAASGGSLSCLDCLSPQTYIGFFTTGLSKERKRLTGAKYGALVVAVSRIGPAYKAGIRKGDILMQVNDRRISNSEDVGSLSRSESSPLLMTVWRNGKQKRIMVHPILDPWDIGFADSSKTACAEIGKQVFHFAGGFPNKDPLHLEYLWVNMASDRTVAHDFKPTKIELTVRREVFPDQKPRRKRG